LSCPHIATEVNFSVKDLAGFLPFVLIALVFWFLIVRPQRRRQHEIASTQSSLGVGTQVMLGSGIFGTVASLDDETIGLEIAPGTTVKVARQAVVKVLDGREHEETQHDTEPDSGPADPADEQRP
jgi:preprotein translocase subunit YajC